MEIVNMIEKNEGNSKKNYRISEKINYTSSFKSLAPSLTSHAEGIRELAKNSENAMIGNKVEIKSSQRDCILFFLQPRKVSEEPMVGLLDFIGFDKK